MKVKKEEVDRRAQLAARLMAERVVESNRLAEDYQKERDPRERTTSTAP